MLDVTALLWLMPPRSTGLLLLVLGLTIGVYWRLKAEAILTRVLLTGLPLMISTGVGKIIVDAYKTPLWPWNGGRLLATVSIMYGYKLYYGPTEGPVSNFNYPPIAAFAYLPVTLMSDPSSVIIFGGFLAAFFFYLPVLVAHLCYFHTSFLARCYATSGFLVFAYLTFNAPPLAYSATAVHVDAPLLGLSAFAGLAISRTDEQSEQRSFILSALAATAALWTKQTIVPIFLILPLWVALTRGWRKGLQLCFYLLGGLAGCTIVFLRAFNPADFFWMTIVIPSRHPWLADLSEPSGPWAETVMARFQVLLQALTELGRAAVPVILLLLAVLMVQWWMQTFVRPIHPAMEDLEHPCPNPRFADWAGRWLQEHPWCLFVGMGFALIPTSLLGRVKVGGDINAYSLVLYFLVLATTLYFVETLLALQTDRLALWGRSLLQWGLVIFWVSNLTIWFPYPGYLAYQLSLSLPHNFFQQAYQFARQHPGEALFPWNLLSSLMAEGKLYHLNYGLFDRDLAGFPLTTEHFWAHMPQNLKYVATYGNAPEYILKYLPEFTQTTRVEGLRRFAVYGRSH